jgi:UDP-glucose 4-epimerase
MIFGWQHASDEVNYFNLGCEGATAVDDIATFVIAALGLRDVRVKHTGGERGWRGDVPQVRLDCSKMKSLGWEARFSSDRAVERACRELAQEIQ